MSYGYDSENAFSEMSASTQFTFTEGHIRLLIWMCDQQAEALENCFDEALKNDEDPSDVVLNCREGVYELKCWALRLLEQLDYPDDDEMEDEDEVLTEDELALQEFRQDLILKSQVHRAAERREERPGPLQKLRLWLLSVLVRLLAGDDKA
tara:strand:+ start:153 stop:605 length:453 start_codon:yes stop_codon:yes gene_type:complete